MTSVTFSVVLIISGSLMPRRQLIDQGDELRQLLAEPTARQSTVSLGMATDFLGKKTHKHTKNKQHVPCESG